VEAIATLTDDSKVVIKFMKKNIYTTFGTPIALLSNNGMYFCIKLLELLLKNYGWFHKVATHYHPYTSGQVELYNRELKSILKKQWIGLIKNGRSNLMMHFRHITLPSRHP